MEKDKVEYLYSLIGNNIREAREAKNISQEKLAELVDVSRSSIVNIEKGRQRLPIHLLWEIASVLTVEPGNFIPKTNIVDKTTGNKINKELLRMIEHKVQGDVEARNKIIEFYLTNS